MSANRSIPHHLNKEPIIEAIWELRFKSKVESIAELLPGMLYSEFKRSYEKIVRLPASDVPLALLQQDTNLVYVPTVRLEGSPFSVQIGERVIALSCRRPYSGWNLFRKKIAELTNFLRAIDLITAPERFSLKYVNVLPESQRTIAPLAVSLRLGDHDLVDKIVQLRAEIRENGFVHIVIIGSPVKATLGEEQLSGILVDIDTIHDSSDQNFWSDFENLLERAHDLNKRLFFHILTEKTTAALEPEY